MTILPTIVLSLVLQAPSPDLYGVYQAIPDGITLQGGLRNSGSPKDIALLPAAEQQRKATNLADDPEKMCAPIGPFRMMARDRTKIELIPALGHGMIVMLFEDLSHGLMRTIYMNRAHPPKASLWLGDSIGRWERDTLVVDTVGFNDSTWLNGAGAQHSDALHMVERIRPVLGGRYLEYTVTAEDPKVFAKPYTYVRYYEKLTTEIMQDVCEE
jgi:hypothetical protein